MRWTKRWPGTTVVSGSVALWARFQLIRKPPGTLADYLQRAAGWQDLHSYDASGVRLFSVTHERMIFARLDVVRQLALRTVGTPFAVEPVEGRDVEADVVEWLKSE